jgi:hypothetical protein
MLSLYIPFAVALIQRTPHSFTEVDVSIHYPHFTEAELTLEKGRSDR